MTQLSIRKCYTQTPGNGVKSSSYSEPDGENTEVQIMGEPLQDRLPDEGETGTDHGSRVDEILCEIESGDGYKLDEVLNRWKDEGLDVTRCRDKRGLSLYATAIENGFLGKDYLTTLRSRLRSLWIFPRKQNKIY